MTENLRPNGTVVYISSLSYSGSSLLSVLLNSQEHMVAVGEAYRVYAGSEPYSCWYCDNKFGTNHVCEFYPKWQKNKQTFHRFCLAKYPCKVVIDSSNNLPLFDRDPRISYKVIMLSKSPESVAFSNFEHKQREVDYCFKSYIANYGKYLDYWKTQTKDYEYSISEFCEFQESFRQYPCDTTTFKYLPYEDLALRPKETIASVCRWLGRVFDERRFETWTDIGNAHIVGGNAALQYQTFKQSNYKRLEELNGKYSGRKGQIFLDQKWREDPWFCGQVREAYQRYEEKLRYILPRLGRGTYEQAVQNLRNRKILIAHNDDWFANDIVKLKCYDITLAKDNWRSVESQGNFDLVYHHFSDLLDEPSRVPLYLEAAHKIGKKVAIAKQQRVTAGFDGVIEESDSILDYQDAFADLLYTKTLANASSH